MSGAVIGRAYRSRSGRLPASCGRLPRGGAPGPHRRPARRAGGARPRHRVALPGLRARRRGRALRLRPDGRRGGAAARPARRSSSRPRPRRSTRAPTRRRRARTRPSAGSPAAPTRRSSRRSTTSSRPGRSPPAGDPLAARARAAAARRGAACCSPRYLLWRLARGSPAVFAVALCFLLWPGVVVRTVTASNAALELPLALGALLALRAAHERRDGRRARARGRARRARPADAALARRARAGARGRRRCRTCAAGAAAPPRSRSRCPRCCSRRGWPRTSTATARRPRARSCARCRSRCSTRRARDLGAGDLRALHGRLLGGVLAEEWWSELLSPAKRRVRDAFLMLAVAVPFGLVLVRRPPGVGAALRAARRSGSR